MLTMNRLIIGAGALLATNAAVAGPTVGLGVPVGRTLGLTLGTTLGALLGQPVGDVLPMAGSALLLVAAVSLALGIYVVRRKRGR